MEIELNNIFEHIADDINEEIFDVLLKRNNIKIERIISNGQASPETGWYDQAQNEWVIVLSGEAIVDFENTQFSLKEGDYLNIPAHTKHKVSWTHPSRQTTWLAIFY